MFDKIYEILAKMAIYLIYIGVPVTIVIHLVLMVELLSKG